MLKFLIPILLILSLTSACATQGRSAGLGAAIGGGTGMSIGAIADPNANGEARTRNVIVGGALGSFLGMAAGLAVHKGMEISKAEGKKEGMASAAQASGNPPQLSQPKVETIWVDSKIVGNRYVEGHFEYLILEPARWQEVR
jgi:hypothetical protein